MRGVNSERRISDAFRLLFADAFLVNVRAAYAALKNKKDPTRQVNLLLGLSCFYYPRILLICVKVHYKSLTSQFIIFEVFVVCTLLIYKA